MIFNEYLDDLAVYEPGKPIELVAREYGIEPENIIKVASNENPFGCSPKALEAMRTSQPALYPDDSYFALKHALAVRFGCESANIIIGSGSDQVMEMAIKAVCNENRGILRAKTTFAMYDIYAKFSNAPVFSANSEFHNLGEMAEIYAKNSANIGAVILCLPNNPLGECPDANEVYEFLELINEDTLVILDCAYMEFAGFKDSKKRIDAAYVLSKFTNVLYSGTFSKAYGLGGMRVGYGLANPKLIEQISKLRPPFNITTPSLAAAIAALDDEDFVLKGIKNNFDEMPRYEAFASEFGLRFIPSYTNFIAIFANEDKNSSILAENLLKKGIILRNLKSYGLNAVRITIGTKAQNDKILEALRAEFA